MWFSQRCLRPQSLLLWFLVTIWQHNSKWKMCIRNNDFEPLFIGWGSVSMRIRPAAYNLVNNVGRISSIKVPISRSKRGYSRRHWWLIIWLLLAHHVRSVKEGALSSRSCREVISPSHSGGDEHGGRRMQGWAWGRASHDRNELVVGEFALGELEASLRIRVRSRKARGELALRKLEVSLR